MFQLLIEQSDYHTLTALYFSLYFGVILKLVWAYGVEESFSGSFSRHADTKFIHPLFFHKRNNERIGSLILIRIVKYIRKKEYGKENDEEPISFLCNVP